MLLNQIIEGLLENEEIVPRELLTKVRYIANSAYQEYYVEFKEISDEDLPEKVVKLNKLIRTLDNRINKLSLKEEMTSIQCGDAFCLSNGTRIYPQFETIEELEKELSTKTQYFYVPLNRYEDITVLNGPRLKIDINDINALASFAITLDMEQAVTEALGYTSALYTYYRQHNDANGALKSCFTKLTSSAEGSEFLTLTIQLQLLEKRFRENGISNEMMETYNRIASEYQRKLALNNERYIGKKSEKEKINKF